MERHNVVPSRSQHHAAILVESLLQDVVSDVVEAVSEEFGSARPAPASASPSPSSSSSSSSSSLCEPVRMLLEENEALSRRAEARSAEIRRLEDRSRKSSLALGVARAELRRAAERREDLEEEVEALRRELCDMATRLCQATEEVEEEKTSSIKLVDDPARELAVHRKAGPPMTRSKSRMDPSSCHPAAAKPLLKVRRPQGPSLFLPYVNSFRNFWHWREQETHTRIADEN